MAYNQLRNVVRHLRKTALIHDGGMTDGELVERFLTIRDEPAFQALLPRPGTMVLGTCPCVQPNGHDAEDVFQAVWLIFLRKGSAITKRESIASWLHRVALRAAVHANSVRRRSWERRASVVPEIE